MLIDGSWISTPETLKVRNPFDASEVGAVSVATAEHVDQALRAAASYDYSLPPHERFAILSRVAELLRSSRAELELLISRESGKPLKEARIEVDRALQTFQLSAEESKRLEGETLPVNIAPGLARRYAFVLRVPRGPVLAVTPFNFPLNLVAHKLAPAIAANNPVILKPSPQAPLTALKLADLLLQAGLPPAMLQVLTGEQTMLVDRLLASDLVRMVSFTGSVPVGKMICRKAGLKKISLELGGSGPLLVLSDADLDAAVSCAVPGVFGNNGQRCTSIRRLILEESIADAFLEKFIALTARLKPGNPLDPEVDVGPLISETAAKNVEAAVEDSLARGGELLFGGKRAGSFFPPTVIDRIRPDFRIVREETFGPVACVLRVPDFEGALRTANDTRYGLQAGIFTNDLRKAVQAAEHIHCGAVVLNDGPGFRAEHLPFGGVRDSGLGREGVRYAVHEMTEAKTIIL